MQAFGGGSLTSFKLHVATCHLPDQVLSAGAAANYMEFWVERMVQLMKRSVKYRSTAYPELIFVNAWMLTQALKRMRSQHPDECKTFAEWVPLYFDRPLSAATYDNIVRPLDGAQLLGCGKPPTEDVYLKCFHMLSEVIESATDPWYTDAGWHKCDIEAGIGGSYLNATLTVFAKAITPSNDMITSTLCRSQYRKDNAWAYVQYHTSNGAIQHCIARMTFFVRAVYKRENVDDDDDGDLNEYGVVPQILRLAVCDLWLCEIVTGKAIMSTFDIVVPDMFKVANLSTNACNATDKGGSYFGEAMLNILEFHTQVVPTLELAGTHTRFFCTASKASGR